MTFEIKKATRIKSRWGGFFYRRDYSGKNNPKWRGGATIDGKGRVYVYRPSHPHANKWGYVYRYRAKMEKKLGRLLRSNEVIHHKDGNCSNDRLSNLELMTFSKHAKVHCATKRRNKYGRFSN